MLAANCFRSIHLLDGPVRQTLIHRAPIIGATKNHPRLKRTSSGLLVRHWTFSADSDKLAASSVLLTGNPGQTTPWDFLTLLMGKLGATDINQLDAHDLPPVASGYPGINWEIQEFELTFTDAKGVAQHADTTCGILNAYGSYSVVLQSISAPENVFDQAKTWLPLLPQSVAAIDPGKIAYQNQLIPVRNHPLDNSGLMESWEQKNLSQDRISKAQREGMMGYERMVSPTTGRYYNMPLERYDGTVGGYRNPDHPNEILTPTQP